MAYPNCVCPTSSNAVILNDIYYYPAEHCLFHQPATLISESAIPAGEITGCSESAKHCSAWRGLHHFVNEPLSSRIDSSAFTEASELPALGLQLKHKGPPEEQALQVIQAMESPEPHVQAIFSRNFRLVLADQSVFPNLIKVFFCAVRWMPTLDPRHIRRDHPQPLVAIRGIGQEINSPASKASPATSVLRPLYMEKYYADLQLEGFEHVAIDILTFHPMM
jgi:hypothetical protein